MSGGFKQLTQRLGSREVWLAWLLLLVLSLVIGLVQPRFWSSGNMINILRHAAPLAVAACAQTLVIIAGEIDLSAGSVVALVSIVTITVARSLGLVPGLVAGVLVGGAAGLLNGWLVGRLGVSSFIATVAMLSYAFGLGSYISGGVPIGFPPPGFNLLGGGYIGVFPVPVLTAAVVYLLVHIVLRHAVLGRRLYFIGGNRRAAGLSGIDVGKNVMWAFLINGLLVGLAGVMLASKVNSGQPHLYPTLAFEAVGAVALGGIPLLGGRGKVSQTLAGVLTLTVLVNGLTLINFSSELQQMIMGIVIVLAVAGGIGLRTRTRSSGPSARGVFG